MTARRLDLVFLGLSLSSSWGNGHATTYRALLRGLAARGHRLLFLERDVPWYAGTATWRSRTSAELELYHGVADLEARFGASIAAADAVVVGSYVPDGIAVIDLVLRSRAAALRLLRHRHADHVAPLQGDAAPISRRARSRRSTSICRSPAARLLQRLEQRVRRPPRLPALLLGRHRALPAAGDAGALGPRLSRHLCRGPPAGAAAAADRAGPPCCPSAASWSPVRSIRLDRLARQCRAHRASAAGGSSPPSTAASASR